MECIGCIIIPAQINFSENITALLYANIITEDGKNCNRFFLGFKGFGMI